MLSGLVYTAGVGPVKLDVAPVKVIAAVPVFRHVGAMVAVSLGSITELPAASTARPTGTTADATHASGCVSGTRSSKLVTVTWS